MTFTDSQKSTSGVKLAFLTGFILFSLTASLAVSAAVLEEVIVTATKRELSSQEIPISLTTFSGEQLRELGISDNYDLMTYVPNLQLKPQFGVTSPDIVLRGIGSQSFFPNTISPVGFYMDNVYVGQSIVQGFQLFDLERVEILRGPQGTLFGRNTTGGLLNVITRKPDATRGTNGFGEVTVGEFGMLNVEAAAGMALSDDLAARVAIFHRDSSGAFDNVNPGRSDKSDGAIDMTSIRAILDWQPNDNLDMQFNVHYGKNDSDITPQKPAFTAASSLPASSLPPAYQPPITNCPPGAPIDGSFQGGCSDPFGFGLTDAPGFRDTQTSFDSFEDVETYGFAAEINWDIGKYTITSLTAWDTADSVRFNDTDGTPLALLHQTDFVDTDFFSQELRITSNFDGAFNWIAGLYYYTDKIDSQFVFNSVDHGPGLGFLVFPLTPLAPFGAATPVGIAQDVHQETDSWAIFGETTYDFADKWKLTLGLRLTQDDREASVNSFIYNAGNVPANNPVNFAQALANASPAALGIPFPLTLIPETTIEKDWFEWSGRVALNYEFAEDQLLFTSATHGFRGGELNGGAIFGVEQAVITDPEFVDSFEFGYKATLLDNSLRINLTGFYMEMKDQQVQVFTPAGGGILPTVLNAGASEISGFEFEAQWQPNDSWFLLLAGAHTNAKLTEFFDPTINLDRSGNTLPDAPKWTVNGIIRYEQPLMNGILALQTDWRWEDERFFTVENTPALVQGSYSVVNLRASYTFWQNKITASLFVKNVFDEDYLLGAYDATNAFSAYIFFPSRPRVIGGSLRYEF